MIQNGVSIEHEEVCQKDMYLSHVELADAIDGPAIMHHCWSLPLCLRKDNVDEVLSCWYNLNLLEVVQHHIE